MALKDHNRLQNGSEHKLPPNSIASTTGVSQHAVGSISDLTKGPAGYKADIDAGRVHPQVDVHSQDIYLLR